MSNTKSASRQVYYGEIAKHNLSPLWESLHSLVPKEPRPQAVPTIWKYAHLRELVMASGDVISAAEAIRRVLILENPGLPGKAKFEFAPRDVFVAPSWQSISLEADEDAVLFSYSNRPVLAALGLLREERK
jgi:gentisate 1,2-dioxygenase